MLALMQVWEADQLARTLFAAFPLAEVRERTLEIYARWLSDLDRANVEDAIDMLIASSTTLPSVAEGGRLVLEAQHLVPTAAEAWVSVNERGVELHELTKRVAETFGGVYNIRTSDEPRIVRAQFFKTYDDLRERHLRELNAASYRGARRVDASETTQAAA